VPAQGSQAVRLLARRRAGTAEGEYRTHMLVQTVPEELGTSIESTLEEDELSVSLVPIFGVSIPVFYRTSTDLSVETFLNKLSLERAETDAAGDIPADLLTPEDEAELSAGEDTEALPDEVFLILDIGRTGPRSILGDVSLSTVSASGKEKEIGRLNGVSIYTPYKNRRARIGVNSKDIQGVENLMVRFYDRERDEGLLVEAMMPIE
jgi:hypothetical protein